VPLRVFLSGNTTTLFTNLDDRAVVDLVDRGTLDDEVLSLLFLDLSAAEYSELNGSSRRGSRLRVEPLRMVT
jgi:hypothetical protein